MRGSVEQKVLASTKQCDGTYEVQNEVNALGPAPGGATNKDRGLPTPGPVNQGQTGANTQQPVVVVDPVQQPVVVVDPVQQPVVAPVNVNLNWCDGKQSGAFEESGVKRECMSYQNKMWNFIGRENGQLLSGQVAIQELQNQPTWALDSSSCNTWLFVDEGTSIDLQVDGGSSTGKWVGQGFDFHKMLWVWNDQNGNQVVSKRQDVVLPDPWGSNAQTVPMQDVQTSDENPGMCQDGSGKVAALVQTGTSQTGQYAEVGAGDCDWHYTPHGKIGVDACAQVCQGRAGCKKFTYGDRLGCRVSSCGSDPGPDACPSDNQCPLASAYGGKAYEMNYPNVGAGDCDWHYTPHGSIGVQACGDICIGRPDCIKFTYGSRLGCRVSSCGSDPGPNACPSDKQCPLASAYGGSVYEVKRPEPTFYSEEGAGDCDWHYTPHGSIGAKACGEICQNRAGCEKFTYGDRLGCRVSSCGSDPGPNACPSDNQCPLASAYGGKTYRIKYPLVSAGDCDWHYTSHGSIGVEACGEICQGRAQCQRFTYGDRLGCRVSSCGSDPGPNQCPQDHQCPLASAYGGNQYTVQRTRNYVATGAGDCDWHYTPHGSIGVEACAEVCRNRDGCVKFTYGDRLGCRVSSCGSDPGPNACPADNQCPLASAYGGTTYEFYSYKGIGMGDCDWHYSSEGKIGVEACAKKCKALDNCDIFTYGDNLGCRVSQCGQDPGPESCPTDKQCPLATAYGGHAYTFGNSPRGEYSVQKTETSTSPHAKGTATEEKTTTRTVSQNGVHTHTSTTTTIVGHAGQMGEGACAGKFTTTYNGSFKGMWDVESFMDKWGTNNQVQYKYSLYCRME